MYRYIYVYICMFNWFINVFGVRVKHFKREEDTFTVFTVTAVTLCGADSDALSVLGICIKKKRVQRFRTSDRDSLDLSRSHGNCSMWSKIERAVCFGGVYKTSFFWLVILSTVTRRICLEVTVPAIVWIRSVVLFVLGVSIKTWSVLCLLRDFIHLTVTRRIWFTVTAVTLLVCVWERERERVRERERECVCVCVCVCARTLPCPLGSNFWQSSSVPYPFFFVSQFVCG